MVFRYPNLNLLHRSHLLRISSNPIRNSLTSLFPIPISSDQNHSKTTRRWHVGHSHHHHGVEGERVSRLGLAADIFLASGKAVTGYLSGSTAIIADAAHSVSDIVLSGVALWSFKAGRAPKDKEHPYGHGKFESLGALGISCMLLATAGGIAWHTVDVLMGLLSTPDTVYHSRAHGHEHKHSHGGHHHGIDMEHPILALNMTLISIGVKEGNVEHSTLGLRQGGPSILLLAYLLYSSFHLLTYISLNSFYFRFVYFPVSVLLVL